MVTRSRLAYLVMVLALSFLTLSFSGAKAETQMRLLIGIDVSGSTRGESFSRIIDATYQVLSNIDPKTRVELFTFNQNLSQVATSSALELSQSGILNTITVGGYTALFDSVLELSKYAKSKGADLLILSDGEDSRSKISSTELLTNLRNGDTRLFLISDVSDQPLRTKLSEIANATNGALYSTQEALLVKDRLAERQATTSKVLVANTLESSSGIASSLAIGVTLLVIMALRALLSWRSQKHSKRTWKRIVVPLRLRETSEKVVHEENSIMTRWARNFVGDSSLILPRITSRIQRELLLLLSVAVIALFLSLFGTPLLLLLPISIFVSLLLLRFWVQSAERLTRESFEKDLPGSLKLIAASLTSGMSFLQALDAFSQEKSSEVARQFRRALSEIQMGAPLERALGEVAERMASEDLRWVVFAFSVQREVGGSLAKILQTSADSIEARSGLRQEVRTLSAEGRLSSYILMLIPPGVFLFLAITRPEFISLFWKESLGNLMLVLVVTLMALAWFWIKRLIRVSA